MHEEANRLRELLAQHGPHTPVTLGMLRYLVGDGEPDVESEDVQQDAAGVPAREGTGPTP